MKSYKSSLMLKYQKARVKLLEYAISEDKWPKFPLNYRELAFPSVYIISKYAEAINEERELDDELEDLRRCAEFYDSALHSREQKIHDIDFALTGASCYFFLNNFGSAKVLWGFINLNEIKDEILRTLYRIFTLIFDGNVEKDLDDFAIQSIINFWRYNDKTSLKDVIEEYQFSLLENTSPKYCFFCSIICAVIHIIEKNSSRILLPFFSDLSQELWEPYFQSKKAILLLWPSQHIVGNYGVLKGNNAVIQLPTGVGKTKSIELIIWSMFLSKRGNRALIVVPLRSLCNEITSELRNSFPNDVTINQFSDVLEDDFFKIIFSHGEKKILVCTPEKLQYILHHDPSFQDLVDLFLFDESHMIDDRERGVLYELLLTNLKIRLRYNQQLVLMSAVLPNGDQIVKWLFNQEGSLAVDSNIRTTPKSIGFSDSNHYIHYFSSLADSEEFYVPCVYEKTYLKLFPKERKKRFFPDTPSDIALYYTNTLCKSGGIAIYFPQKRSIPAFFKRVLDVISRGYDLSNICNVSDREELLKFKQLFEKYYGKNDFYTITVQYGVLPHYSSLPNGIKISTEYAFKKKKIKVVACTSTLAQGVNIPIKYLLLTGMNFLSDQMSVRNFQNLIGRTGRSGVYTEGDIVVTDNKLFDEFSFNRIGNKKWNDIRSLFDSSCIEPCGSSILNLVRDFDLTRNVRVYSKDVLNVICDNFLNDWPEKLRSFFVNKARSFDVDTDSNNFKSNIIERINNYKLVIDSIENEIIYLISQESQKNNLNLIDISNSILNKTFAFYLADDNEKVLLKKLVNSIDSEIESLFYKIPLYSKTMLPIVDVNQIIQWISTNNINHEEKSLIELLQLIELLFGEIYPHLKLKQDFSQSWIRGDSYEDLTNSYNYKKIQDVEKICHYNISFQMSFLVGNIIDLLHEDCVNQDKIRFLQQALKYGVNTQTAVSICENVFNDRLLAKDITEILKDEYICSEHIVSRLYLHIFDVLNYLNDYPSFFRDTLLNLR